MGKWDQYAIPEPAAAGKWDKYRVSTPTPPPEPAAFSPESKSGAALRGFGQGASLGFTDELRGGIGAMDELGSRLGGALGWESRGLDQTRPTQGVIDALKGRYLEDRDAARKEEHQAEAAHPALYGASELAGGLAVPIPGGGAAKGAGLGTKMLRGAVAGGVLGTAIGAGKSEAEDASGVAHDALGSGLVAAPLGAAGAALGHGLGKLADRFGGRSAEIKAAKAAKDAEELMAERAGRYGQKVQDSNRALENMRAVLANPEASVALKSRVQSFLQSAAGKDLVNQVGENTLEEAPKKLHEMAELKHLRSIAPTDAAQATADYFNKSTLKEDVLPRAKKYAARMVPQAVADAAGDMAGGAKGVAAGVLGALTGAAVGAPGTSLANLMQKTPRFNAQLFSALESGSRALESALGQAGPQFAAQATAAGRKKVLEDALATDPEAAVRVEAALKQPGFSEKFGGKR
jgi:hypothetical protein